jgi:hypothetical protein
MSARLIWPTAKNGDQMSEVALAHCRFAFVAFDLYVTPSCSGVPRLPLVNLPASLSRASPRGVYAAINDPLATVNTFAQSVNNKDQIVGFYQNATSNGTPSINHGFLYSGGQKHVSVPL